MTPPSFRVPERISDPRLTAKGKEDPWASSETTGLVAAPGDTGETLYSVVSRVKEIVENIDPTKLTPRVKDLMDDFLWNLRKKLPAKPKMDEPFSYLKGRYILIYQILNCFSKILGPDDEINKTRRWLNALADSETKDDGGSDNEEP